MGWFSDLFKNDTTTTQQTTLDPYIKEQSQKLGNLAQNVGSIGYVPNTGPAVAGFTPMQMSAFGNTNDAAKAFNMQHVNTNGMNKDSIYTALTGMAPPTDFGDVQGYSSFPLYQQMLAGIPEGQRNAIDSFFIDPVTGKGGNWQNMNNGVNGMSEEEIRNMIAERMATDQQFREMMDRSGLTQGMGTGNRNWTEHDMDYEQAKDFISNIDLKDLGGWAMAAMSGPLGLAMKAGSSLYDTIMDSPSGGGGEASFGNIGGNFHDAATNGMGGFGYGDDDAMSSPDGGW